MYTVSNKIKRGVCVWGGAELFGWATEYLLGLGRFSSVGIGPQGLEHTVQNYHQAISSAPRGSFEKNKC